MSRIHSDQTHRNMNSNFYSVGGESDGFEDSCDSDSGSDSVSALGSSQLEVTDGSVSSFFCGITGGESDVSSVTGRESDVTTDDDSVLSFSDESSLGADDRVIECVTIDETDLDDDDDDVDLVYDTDEEHDLPSARDQMDRAAAAKDVYTNESVVLRREPDVAEFGGDWYFDRTPEDVATGDCICEYDDLDYEETSESEDESDDEDSCDKLYY